MSSYYRFQTALQMIKCSDKKNMKKNVGYNKKPATIVWLENDFRSTWNGLIDCLTSFMENQLRELLTQLKDQNY